MNVDISLNNDNKWYINIHELSNVKILKNSNDTF